MLTWLRGDLCPQSRWAKADPTWMSTTQCGLAWDVQIPDPEQVNQGCPQGAHALEGNKARLRLRQSILGARGIWEFKMHWMGV